LREAEYEDICIVAELQADDDGAFLSMITSNGLMKTSLKATQKQFGALLS